MSPHMISFRLKISLSTVLKPVEVASKLQALIAGAAMLICINSTEADIGVDVENLGMRGRRVHIVNIPHCQTSQSLKLPLQAFY